MRINSCICRKEIKKNENPNSIEVQLLKEYIRGYIGMSTRDPADQRIANTNPCNALINLLGEVDGFAWA